MVQELVDTYHLIEPLTDEQKEEYSDEIKRITNM